MCTAQTIHTLVTLLEYKVEEKRTFCTCKYLLHRNSHLKGSNNFNMLLASFYSSFDEKGKLQLNKSDTVVQEIYQENVLL